MSKKSHKRRRLAARLGGIVSDVAGRSRIGFAQAIERVGQHPGLSPRPGPREMPLPRADRSGRIALWFEPRFPTWDALEERYGDEMIHHLHERNPEELPVWEPQWKKPEDLDLRLLRTLIGVVWVPLEPLHVLELLALQAP